MIAFGKIVEDTVKATSGRKPKKTVMQGLAFSQSRFIRIRFAHFRRSQGLSDFSIVKDEDSDDHIRSHLQHYQVGFGLQGRGLGLGFRVRA